jgi:oligosaccharide repeat unit polymerase
VVLASILIFAASLAVFFAVVGYSTYLDTPRSLRHFLYEKAPGAGFLVDFSGTAAILLSVLILERYRGRPAKALAWIAVVLLPYAIFHQAIFSGSRIQIVRVLAILVIYWQLRIHPISIRRLLLYGFGLMVLIIVLGVARSGLGEEEFDLLTEIAKNLDSWDAFLTLAVYALDFPTTYDIFLMMTNHRPDFDLGYGVTYAKLLLSFIPRDIWPEKPENITWIATQLFRPEMLDLGVSYNPTILGEMYYNFGLLGVVGGGLIFGTCCRLLFLYYYAKRNSDRVGALLIYSALTFSILEQFRGAFSNITTHYIAFYVVPIFAVSILTGTRFGEQLDPTEGREK